jgi:hypothetical protein
MHSHIQLIPRRQNDMVNPRGGVRGAMPRFETIRRLLAALDVQLTIKPARVRAQRQRA